MEEADETIYWLELIDATTPDRSPTLTWLLNESQEITKIVASIKKAYEQ